jgi:hypothetical protein
MRPDAENRQQVVSGVMVGEVLRIPSENGSKVHTTESGPIRRLLPLFMAMLSDKALKATARTARCGRVLKRSS